MEKARPVSLKEIRIRDNFWDKYRKTCKGGDSEISVVRYE